ncbi:MAG: hypothetical protein U9R48_10290 [Chloroflexota bacterium]|nr:hypothetical protein [Chloroflexota bacterium]
MCAKASKVHIRELANIIIGLPEEKVQMIISYARRIKDKEEKPTKALGSEEILALAVQRAEELRRLPRPVVEAQYQALLDALQADVTAKGIKVEEYPRGD